MSKNAQLCHDLHQYPAPKCFVISRYSKVRDPPIQAFHCHPQPASHARHSVERILEPGCLPERSFKQHLQDQIRPASRRLGCPEKGSRGSTLEKKPDTAAAKSNSPDGPSNGTTRGAAARFPRGGRSSRTHWPKHRSVIGCEGVRRQTCGQTRFWDIGICMRSIILHMRRGSFGVAAQVAEPVKGCWTQRLGPDLAFAARCLATKDADKAAAGLTRTNGNQPPPSFMFDVARRERVVLGVVKVVQKAPPHPVLLRHTR